MTDLNTLIAMAKELNASDVHIVSGLPVRCRVDGSIRNLTEELLTFEDCENYGRAMAGPRFSEIEEMGELDLAQSFPCGAWCPSVWSGKSAPTAARPIPPRKRRSAWWALPKMRT